MEHDYNVMGNAPMYNIHPLPTSYRFTDVGSSSYLGYGTSLLRTQYAYPRIVLDKGTQASNDSLAKLVGASIIAI